MVTCPAFKDTRERMYVMWLSETVMFPTIHALIREILHSDESTKACFILEPLTVAEIRADALSYGSHYIETISYLARTFLFCMNREYLKSVKLNLS